MVLAPQQVENKARLGERGRIRNGFIIKDQRREE